MANRNIKVTLSAEVGQYEAGMRRAKASTEQMGATATQTGDKTEQAHQKSAQAAAEHAANVEKTSKILAGFGTVTVGALGLAANAAIDWESAWAGVNKTVDGTPEQMAALEGELRELATTLPLTHKEIAAVAESAGQLGIAREDITSFTKTMIDLGESTNLSAEEASTSIAQMMNVMQTAPDDVDNLGAALVALGNNGASTERDIIQMAQRLAGSAKLVGASEADVLALANTMSSLGISAEMGGGAMSRVMQDIYSSVESGGDKLEKFAEVAGMTSEEFATAFREDPITAIDAFTQGLGRIGEEGGNVVGTLSELGIKSTEETRALLSMAGAQDMLSNSLKLGAESWEANTALVEEATKRYETTEAQIRIAWNGIQDAAISAGGVLLPVIAGVAESVSDLAGAFSALPAPAQAALTSFTGLVGVASLVGGGFFLMLPKVQESRAALAALGPAGARANTVLGKLGKAAGIATAALAGLAVAGKISDSFVADNKSVTEFAQALLLASEEGENMKDVFADGNLFASSNDFALTAGGIDSVGEALARVNNRGLWTKFRDGVNETFSGIASSQIVETKESLEAMDAAVTSFAESGALDQAAASFRGAVEEGEALGVSMETTAQSFPQYLDHLRGLAQEQDYALGSTKGLTAEQELLNWAMGEAPAPIQAAADAAENAAAADATLESSLQDVGLAADGTVESLGDYLDMLFSAGLAVMSTRDAQFAFEESLRGIDDTIKQITESEENLGSVLNKSKDDFNATTEAGALANTAFQDIAQSGFEVASAMAEAGESQEDIQGSLQGTYEGLVKAAEQFGITGQDAKNLAREVMGVPEGVSIESWMSDTAQETATETKNALFQLPDGVDIDSFMSDSAERMAILTKAGIDNIPNSDEVKSYMEDDAFVTALRTRAAVLGIPAEDVVNSFMSSAARNEADKTTAEVLGIPDGASVSSFMSSSAKVEAWATKAAVDSIPSTKRVTITTIRNFVQGSLNNSSSPLPDWASSTGRRLPKYSNGGRMPLTGPGTYETDGILGISSLTGEPTSFVDKGEWIINGRMSERYNAELAAMNAGTFPKLHGYADGGRAGESGPRVGSQFAASAVGKTINVTYHSYNAVQESESKIIETSNSHLAALVGGI